MTVIFALLCISNWKCFLLEQDQLPSWLQQHGIWVNETMLCQGVVLLEFSYQLVDSSVNFNILHFIFVHQGIKGRLYRVDFVEEGLIGPEYRVNRRNTGFLKLGADLFEWQ